MGKRRHKEAVRQRILGIDTVGGVVDYCFVTYANLKTGEIEFQIPTAEIRKELKRGRRNPKT